MLYKKNAKREDMFEHPLQQNGHEHLQGRRSLHSRHTETTNVKFWCGSHVFQNTFFTEKPYFCIFARCTKSIW